MAGESLAVPAMKGASLAMFVTLFGLTRNESRDAPDASWKRHVFDARIALRGDCSPQ
jgi:hypothetical protein